MSKYIICKINLIYKCKKAIKIHRNWKINLNKMKSKLKIIKDMENMIIEIIKDIKKISSKRKSVDLDLLILKIGKMKLERTQL